MDNSPNYDFIRTIASIIAALITVSHFRKRNNDTLLIDKYQKLIFPIFAEIEPFLYKTPDKNIFPAIEKIKNIHRDNQDLSPFNLTQALDNCLPCNKCTQEQFNELCRIIDKELDICCSKLGIKKRSLIYRLSHKQYANKLQLIFIMSLQIFHDIVLAGAILIIALSLLATAKHLI